MNEPMYPLALDELTDLAKPCLDSVTSHSWEQVKDKGLLKVKDGSNFGDKLVTR